MALLLLVFFFAKAASLIVVFTPVRRTHTYRAQYVWWLGGKTGARVPIIFRAAPPEAELFSPPWEDRTAGTASAGQSCPPVAAAAARETASRGRWSCKTLRLSSRRRPPLSFRAPTLFFARTLLARPPFWESTDQYGRYPPPVISSCVYFWCGGFAKLMYSWYVLPSPVGGAKRAAPWRGL